MMQITSARLQAVTVNHNTSHFVELLLRTLYLTNDLGGIDLNVTVLDNASQDAHLPALRAYLDAQQIPLLQTGYDCTLDPDKHGAALAHFIMERDACSHYLLLDSDAWFVERDTVPTMLRELQEAGPAAFAVQARINGYYAHRIIEGRGGAPGASDAVELAPWETTLGNGTYTTRAFPRCSPVCCLLANTPVFRRAVETIGLGRAIAFEVAAARWYDTMALLTQVMATHQLGFVVSSKTVNHFTMTGYQEEARPLKDRDCLTMLAELRAERGMGAAFFRESFWNQQTK
jgi:hypothetical protein